MVHKLLQLRKHRYITHCVPTRPAGPRPILPTCPRPPGTRQTRPSGIRPPLPACPAPTTGPTQPARRAPARQQPPDPPSRHPPDPVAQHPTVSCPRPTVPPVPPCPRPPLGRPWAFRLGPAPPAVSKPEGGFVVATTKDRNKDGFFRRNFNQLPQSIKDEYPKATPKEKRRLVNDVVARDDSSGMWYISVKAAILKEWQEKYLDVRKDKGVITKPGGLAAALWGGWAGLDEARRRGEVWTVTAEGREWYQWREFSEVEREGHRGGLAIEGTRKLDIVDYNKINKTLSQYGCSLDLQPGAIGDTDRSSKLADLPKKVLDNLGKVQKACDRAIGDAKGLFRRIDELSHSDPTAKALGVKLKADWEATPSQDSV